MFPFGHAKSVLAHRCACFAVALVQRGAFRGELQLVRLLQLLPPDAAGSASRRSRPMAAVMV